MYYNKPTRKEIVKIFTAQQTLQLQHYFGRDRLFLMTDASTFNGGGLS